MSRPDPIVVPGGGCEACFAHRIGIELYTLQLTEPDQLVTWDVTLARHLVKERDAEPEPCSAVEALKWVTERGNINEPHLAHIPEATLDEPLLVDAIYIAEKPGDPLTLFPVLIDGSHRVVLHVMRKLPLTVIFLTPEEHERVMSVTPGRIEELMRERKP